ncbi:hypothetical protein [Trichothermofontia sp.]
MNYAPIQRSLVLGAIVLTLLCTIVVNALPLNGLTTSAVTNRYLTYLTPAEFTFGIWGAIDLGLLGFGIYQILPNTFTQSRLPHYWPWVLLNGFATCLWLVLWSYEWLFGSVLAMLGMLLSLIAIYQQLQADRGPTSWLAYGCVQVPFRLYLGWLTLTMMANMAVWLTQSQWDGAGMAAPLWASLLVGVSGVMAGTIAWKFADVAYVIGVLWAYTGIAVRYAMVPVLYPTLIGAIVIVLVLLGIGIWRRQTQGLRAEGWHGDLGGPS